MTGAVSFRRVLDGTRRKLSIDQPDCRAHHRELQQVIHALQCDPGPKISNLTFSRFSQDRIAAHEYPEQQAKGGALNAWGSASIEERIQVRNYQRLHKHREHAQGDDVAWSRKRPEPRVDILEQREMPASREDERENEVTRCRKPEPGAHEILRKRRWDRKESAVSFKRWLDGSLTSHPRYDAPQGQAWCGRHRRSMTRS